MTDKLAFVFPGQGSQRVGMLADYLLEPIVQRTFAEAAEVLGFDLLKIVTEGSAEQLDQTVNTQPALLVSSVALWRLWTNRKGEVPAMMAGHSLGEYSALTCAGSIAFVDAVKLVRHRGLCMQEAVSQNAGGMAAIIGLDDSEVVAICDQTAATGDRMEVVQAANFNAPGQVVIAGHRSAVKRATELAKKVGAKKALELSVSVPSHSVLMQPAAERFQEQLDLIKIVEPSIPVVQNVSALVCSDPVEIKSKLIAQLYSPVRWTESIETMITEGIGRFVECGPGKVLSGLNKRIARRVPIAAFDTVDGMNQMLIDR